MEYAFVLRDKFEMDGEYDEFEMNEEGNKRFWKLLYRQVGMPVSKTQVTKSEAEGLLFEHLCNLARIYHNGVETPVVSVEIGDTIYVNDFQAKMKVLYIVV